MVISSSDAGNLPGLRDMHPQRSIVCRALSCHSTSHFRTSHRFQGREHHLSGRLRKAPVERTAAPEVVRSRSP